MSYQFKQEDSMCCRVFGDTKVDATILASTIERLLNEYTSRKPDIKIVGDDA